MTIRQAVDLKNDPYLKMGDRLKQMRVEKNMTISILAETLDLSEKIISNYEKGKNKITIETLIKIYQTKALGDRSLEEILQIFIIEIFDTK